MSCTNILTMTNFTTLQKKPRMHNTQVSTYRLDVDKRMIHTKELLNTKETSLANVKVLKQRASHTHTSVSNIYTVKSLIKGHFGDNINSHALSLVERLFKLYCYLGKQNYQVPKNVHYREILNTVSLYRRVHYR